MTALTIRRDFPRADLAAAKPLFEVPSGNVCDAQGRVGALDHGIKPVGGHSRFIGTALTVDAGPRDNLAPWAALTVARPGDVLVVRTGDHLGASVAGDLLLGMARNAGVVAFVTDGLVRDVAGIDALPLPAFARGVTPNSPQKNGPGSVGLPVVVGGVTVAPGDIVVGDAEGVVVVPRERLAEVVEELAKVRAKEEAGEAAVAGGATAPDWLAAALEGKGVRYLDGN